MSLKMIEIRRATEDETEECNQVLHSAFHELVGRLGRQLTDMSFSILPEAIVSGRVMVAATSGRIVGLAITSDDGSRRSIEYVGTDVNEQGRGIGSNLLKAIERDAVKAGVTTLHLNTVEFASELVQLYSKH